MTSIGFRNPGFQIPSASVDVAAKKFSSEDWAKNFSAAITGATTNGKVDGAALAASGLIDQLDNAPPETRFQLVLDTLLAHQSVGGRAADVVAELIAKRYEQPVAQVRANVFTRLEVLCKEPVRDLNHISKIETKVLIAGKTTVELAGADMSKLTGVDVICIPGHRANAANGGGARGGVELAFMNRAQQLGDVKMQEAINSFEKMRGENVLQPGATIAVPSGTSRSVSSAAFVMGASVPPPSVQANNAGLGAAHLAHVLKSYLDDAVTRGLDMGGRKPSEKNPPTIVLTAMCIGVERALSAEAAGGVYKDVLSDWAKDHPGVRVVVTVLNPATRAAFEAGFAGNAAASASATKTPDRLLDDVVAGLGVASLGNSGTTLNAASVGAGLDTALKSLASAMPARPSADAYDFVADFKGRPQMEAAWQMHRFVTVPAFASALGGGSTADTMKTLLDVLAGKKKAPNAELAGLRDEVIREVLAHPEFKDVVVRGFQRGDVGKAHQFGGAEKLPEVLSLAVAKVLRSHRTDALDTVVAEHKAAMADLSKQMNDSIAALELKMKNTPDAGQIGLLRAKLAAAEAGTAEVGVLRTELRGLSTKNVKLEGEVRRLEDALARQQSLTTSYQSRVASSSSSS